LFDDAKVDIIKINLEEAMKMMNDYTKAIHSNITLVAKASKPLILKLYIPSNIVQSNIISIHCEKNEL
jgi:hypothetical protein